MLPILYLSLSPLNVGAFNLVQVGLDDSIKKAVAALQAKGSKIQLVDINSRTQSQAFPCNTNTNGSSDINGVFFAPGSSLSSIFDNCVFNSSLGCSSGWKKVAKSNILANESFHPTESAHQYMAAQVEAAMANFI